MPTSKSILRHTWEKGAQYLKKMGGIIMIASILIWFLGYYPRHEAYGSAAEQQEHSYIGQIGKAIEPAIKPLGFDWKLGIGLISGVGLKGTCGQHAGSALHQRRGRGERKPFRTHPHHAAGGAGVYAVRPDLFPVYRHIHGHQARIRQLEMAFFAAGYTTLLAWLVAFCVYQIGNLIV